MSPLKYEEHPEGENQTLAGEFFCSFCVAIALVFLAFLTAHLLLLLLAA